MGKRSADKPGRNQSGSVTTRNNGKKQRLPTPLSTHPLPENGEPRNMSTVASTMRTITQSVKKKKIGQNKNKHLCLCAIGC